MQSPKTILNEYVASHRWWVLQVEAKRESDESRKCSICNDDLPLLKFDLHWRCDEWRPPTPGKFATSGFTTAQFGPAAAGYSRLLFSNTRRKDAPLSNANHGRVAICRRRFRCRRASRAVTQNSHFRSSPSVALRAPNVIISMGNKQQRTLA